MRLARLLFPLLLLPIAAIGQIGIRYDANVTTSAKNVPSGAQANVMTLPFAKITICGYPNTGDPCTNLATIYSDAALTQPINQATNPIIADSQGRYGFWVAGALYTYSVQTAGGTNVGTFPLSLNSPPGPQGPGGIGCATGNCIVGASSVNQPITQASGTSLQPNNLATSITPQVDIRAYGAVSGASDVTTSVQTAVNFAITIGGIVYFPPGVWNLNGPINPTCNAIICIPAVASTSNAAQIKIIGSTRIRQDAQGTTPSTIGSVIVTTTNTGTDNNSAIFGVTEVAGNFGNMNNVDVYFSDLTMRTYPNPKIGCIYAFWASGASIDHIRCEVGEIYTGTHTQPTFISTAIQLPGVNNDTLSRFTWSQITGYYRGLIVAEHAYLEGDWIAFGIQGIYPTSGFYPFTGKVGMEEVGTPIFVAAGTGSIPVDLVLGVELDPTGTFSCSSWCYSDTDIDDQTDALKGMIRYTEVTSNVGNSAVPLRIKSGSISNLTTYNEYTQHWTNNANDRTQFTVAVPGTANADGLLTGISTQFADVNTVLGHWNVNQPGKLEAGVLQVYNTGTGNTLGTSHYNFYIQPFGGDTTIGSGAGTLAINGTTISINGTAGITTSVTTGGCTLNFTQGVLTSKSGC